MEWAEDVVCAAYRSFSLPVLHGCVRARQMERDVIGREEGGEVMVDELAAIVALQSLDDYMVLY